jgi:hypothetical protein
MSIPAFIKKSLKALRHKEIRKTGRICAFMRIVRFILFLVSVSCSISLVPVAGGLYVVSPVKGTTGPSI